MPNKSKIIGVVVLIILVAGLGFWMYKTPRKVPSNTNNTGNTPTPNPSADQLSAQTSLALSPTTSSVSVGSKFDVKVVLDTAGQAIDGVDIYKLNYDPALLSLSDTPGDLMANTTFNKINAGTLIFSQITSGGQKYTGTGTLVTLHFTALKAGTANVTFDFVPGASNKTNIAAAGGKNILSQVVNGMYTIK